MPTSAGECKAWIKATVDTLGLQSALDVGPGMGTYRRLLPQLEMDAVEIWAPYVREFDLESIYRRVWLSDFLDFDTDERWDLVILGDVIEHFDEAGARECWDHARRLAGLGGFVVCSTPILPWPQGHEHGNPYEEHKFQFDWDGLVALDGVVDGRREDPIGAVLATGI